MKQKFDHATYIVFGARVHQKKLLAGDTYKVHVSSNTLSKHIGNNTIFTKGHITGTDASEVPDLYERAPGFHTMTDTPVVAGTYTFTAVEDSEWWCINEQINRRYANIAVSVTPFCLSAGESITLAVGAKLLLCEGELVVAERTFKSADAIQVETQDLNATAVGNCYGYIFNS